MRDQMDAQIWNAHHDQFSEWLDGLVLAAGAKLRGSFERAGQAPAQLLAGLLAVSVTLATFGASAA